MATKEYHRLWRKKNLEKCRASSLKCYYKHREERDLKKKIYKIENREQIKVYHQHYRKEHAKQYRIYDQNRRSKTGRLTIKGLQNLYEGNIKTFGTLTCYLCLRPIEFGQDSVDHRIPLSRGGTHTIRNLGVVHRLCNSLKGVKTEEEYRCSRRCRRDK